MSRPAPEDLEDACRLTSPERLRPTKRLKTTATTTTMMIHSTEDADVITKMEVDSVAPASASSTMSPPIGDPNKEDMGAEPKIITTSSLNFSSSTSSTSPSSSSSSRDESTFQKVNKLQKYVPYAAHLTKTREELWGNLQANLLSAIAAQGQPLLEWLHACEQYLSAFGFAFSKADHLMLVHLCWRALFTIEHDYTVMRQLTKLLTRLLRETKLLSRTDLQLDWRPLHQLQELTSYSAAARKQTVLFEPEFSTEIRELTAYSRPYFSAASTSEMLTSWRPLLCPYSNQYRKYIAYLRSFLPTMLPPKEHHQGFKLWFDDFMTLWTALPNQELDEYGCYAHLFAMLARDALGYIDWEPHLPLLFERLKKSFNGLMMLSTELTLSAQWIVYMIYPGSGCLASLKQLFAFRLVDGRNMLNAIMEEFIGRIREERGGGNGGEKKKKHWYDYVPESHKLTDAIIADFAAFIWEQYLLSSATTVSSAADFDVEYLYRLSLFCPEQLPKEVVSRLSLAHERFFEPARLQPALQLFSVSLYHLLTNEKVGERYRPEVVPIMRRLIGSLNTNDHSLCYLHLFAIRSVVILGLPIEDLSGLAESKKKSQLTSAQRKALKSTAQLEAFAEDFLRLCFTIVESNNEDLFGVSKKGLGMKTILYDIFTGLLANVRPAAFRSLVDTLYRYVRGRTVEGANSCFILHKLILATVVMDRGDSYALPKFFKGITASLLEVIEEKEKFSEVCRSEFVYHLTLFTGCFKDGRAMLKYRPALVDLFRRLLALDFQENSQHITLVTNAIGCLFNVVTSIYPSEPAYGARKFFGGSKDQKEVEEEDEDETLKRFLTGWPYEVSLKAIDNRWYVPGPEETDFARALFREFIRPQMDLLRSWVDGTSKLEVNKAALEKALGIILSFSGFRDCLPKFDDPEAAAAERYFTTAEDVFALDLFDGGEEGEGEKSPLPFRDDLVQLMGRVLRRLKDCPGDNVSSLRLIIKILDFAMFPADAVNAASPADFSLVDEYAASGDDGALAAAMDLQSGGGGGGSSKNLCVFSSIYRTLEGRKKTAYIPLVQYSRLGDYHLRMLSLLKSWPNAQLTAPHRATIEQLFELATGSSADVRADAQAILFDVMESYPQSYPLITTKLAAYLGRQQPSEHYDAFKGTLHLLLGTATKSLLLSESWTALNALWPALLQANWCVEKPKIVDMLDNDLLPLLFGYFYTVPVERKVAILGGFEKELLSQAEQRGFRAPSQEEVAKVEAAIAEENGKNVALYGELVGRLVEILEEHKLHWRFYNLGLSLLSFLIRYDRPFPDEAAALFLENLVHDSFKIRLTATSALRKILFLRKKEQLTKDASSTTTTNTITVQDVDFDSLPLDPLATGGVEAYESTVFYDKAHIGYYPGCSYQMVVKQGKARKTPENEDFIFTKFSDEAFLGKLFALFAIEREKDEQMSELMETLEKVQDMVPMDNAGLSMISAVDENFVKLWQYLASMYGLFNHQRLLFPRLEALLEEGRPHSDKVVVEVLVGLVKAAPALSGAEMASLNAFLRRLFDRHLERFHGESKNSWSYLFSSFFANRDRRRFGWVVDYFLRGENQLLEEGSTMTMSGQSAYLAFLSTVLADNWQWPAVGEAVLAKLERHLDHPYQTVRLAIASLLSKSVFYPRIGVAMNVSTDASDMRPSLVAFIGRTVERLDRSLGPLLVAKDGDKKDENSEDDDKGEEGGGGGGGMAAVKSALFDKDSAEGVRLHNYIETVAQWVFGGLINRYLVNSSDFLPFLPYMCVIHTPNKPVQALVNKVVSTLSVMPYPNGELPAIQATVGRLSTNWNWHSRHEMTIFLNNFFFSSIYQLRAAEPELGTLSSLQLILLSLLADEKIEVRESARRTLTNIIAWEVMDAAAKQSLLDRFIASYREKTELREKHAAALGVCAFVYANKRQMTAFLANVVIYLCRLLTDPLPAVQKSVSETLKAFMKGHSDNWVEHKKMFTAEQLAELADISIFSSYIS